MEKKKLIQIGLTGVLAVVLLFAASNCSKRVKQAKRPVKQAAQAAPSVKNAPAQDLSAAVKAPAAAGSAKPLYKPLYQIQEEESRNLQPKRNPFETIAAQTKKAASAPVLTVNLTGILWDKDKPLAIINGKIVKAGDRVSGCNVVRIKENSVVLNDGEKDFELKLGR